MRFSLSQNKHAGIRVELPAKILGEGISTRHTQGELSSEPRLFIHSSVITAKRDRNKGLKGQKELWDNGDVTIVMGE